MSDRLELQTFLNELRKDVLQLLSQSQPPVQAVQYAPDAYCRDVDFERALAAVEEAVRR